MSMKFRYVEFIGVPGSGKTKLSRILRDTLESEGHAASVREPIGVSITTKVQIAFEILRAIARTPSLLSFWLSPVVGEFSGTPHARSVAFNLRLRLIIECAVVRHALSIGDGVVINDEGIVGKFVMLAILTNMSEDSLGSWVKKILPQETLLVYVDTPDRVARTRFAERDTPVPFFDDMNERVRERIYIKSNELYESVCKSTITIEKVASATIDNRGDISESRQEMTKLLKILL